MELRSRCLVKRAPGAVKIISGTEDFLNGASDMSNLNNLIDTWARGYKTFLMLNSAEHEILNAHKYKNIQILSNFQAQISPKCYFYCS